jgi:hypothetical protein
MKKSKFGINKQLFHNIWKDKKESIKNWIKKSYKFLFSFIGLYFAIVVGMWSSNSKVLPPLLILKFCFHHQIILI